MKKSLYAVLISALCLGLIFSCNTVSDKKSVASVDIQAPAAPGNDKITVLNPLGTPPPIEVKQMAPRLDSLDGKTIYLINTGFPNSGRLLEEIGNWFKANYPKTKMVVSRAGMDNIPPNVMAEIKEKADAVMLGVGH